MKKKPEIVEITLYGRIPSKKNSRNQYISGGKIVLVNNKKFKEWHKERMEGLGLFKMMNKINDPIDCQEITLKFLMPDNRRADLTNKAESVMDLLVDCGILKDDCWQLTGPVTLIPLGIDRKKPRVEILITKRGE